MLKNKYILSFLFILSSIASNLYAIELPSNLDDNQKKQIEQKLGQQNNNLVNKADGIVPDGCKLSSYTLDGTHFLFKCNNTDVVSIIMYPPDQVSGAEAHVKSIIDKLENIANCKTEEVPLSIGKHLKCMEKDGLYHTFLAAHKSGLITSITTSEQFTDTNKLANIQNFSLVVYFFLRNIAKDQEQIEYLNKLLGNSRGVETIQDLYRFNQ